MNKKRVSPSLAMSDPDDHDLRMVSILSLHPHEGVFPKELPPAFDRPFSPEPDVHHAIPSNKRRPLVSFVEDFNTSSADRSSRMRQAVAHLMTLRRVCGLDTDKPLVHKFPEIRAGLMTLFGCKNDELRYVILSDLIRTLEHSKFDAKEVSSLVSLSEVLIRELEPEGLHAHTPLIQETLVEAYGLVVHRLLMHYDMGQFSKIHDDKKQKLFAQVKALKQFAEKKNPIFKHKIKLAIEGIKRLKSTVSHSKRAMGCMVTIVKIAGILAITETPSLVVKDIRKLIAELSKFTMTQSWYSGYFSLKNIGRVAKQNREVMAHFIELTRLDHSKHHLVGCIESLGDIARDSDDATIRHQALERLRDILHDPKAKKSARSVAYSQLLVCSYLTHGSISHPVIDVSALDKDILDFGLEIYRTQRAKYAFSREAFDSISRLREKNDKCLPEVWNVPAPQPSHVSRQSHIDKLWRAIGSQRKANGHSVMVVTGRAGIGKTMFAEEYARAHAKSYSFVWKIRATGKESMRKDCLELASYLGIEGYDDDSMIRGLKANLATRNDRFLLLIDQADDVDTIDALNLTCRHGDMIVTSREEKSDAASFALPAFSVQEGVDFLRSCCPHLHEHSKQSDRALVKRLGCLPASIAMAANSMNVDSKRSDEYLSSLDRLSASLVLWEGIEAILADKDAKALLSAMSVLARGHIPRHVINNMLQSYALDKGLATIQKGLPMSFTDEGALQVDASVLDYIFDSMEASEKRLWVNKALDIYLDGDVEVSSHIEHVSRVATLAVELKVDALRSPKMGKLLMDLALATPDASQAIGYFHAALECLSNDMSKDSKRRQVLCCDHLIHRYLDYNDHIQVAKMLDRLRDLEQRPLSFDFAIYMRAGLAYLQRGDIEEAKQQFKVVESRLEALLRDINTNTVRVKPLYKRRIAETLSDCYFNLATIARYTDDRGEIERYLRRSAQTLEGYDIRTEKAAKARIHLGDFIKASLSKSESRESLAARAMHNYVLALRCSHTHDASLSGDSKESLVSVVANRIEALCEYIGKDYRFFIDTLRELGLTSSSFEESVSYFESAIELIRYGEANENHVDAGTLVEVYTELGIKAMSCSVGTDGHAFRDPVDYFKAALRELRESQIDESAEGIPSTLQEARLCNHIGEALTQQGKPSEALSYYEKSEAFHRKKFEATLSERHGTPVLSAPTPRAIPVTS